MKGELSRPHRLAAQRVKKWMLTSYGLVFFLLILLISIQIVLQFQMQIVTMKEDVMMRFFPTAERAYAYGKVHFSETINDPTYYDIRRAEYYYLKAARMDPDLPLVYHQLARISFIDGVYDAGMARINIQIDKQGELDASSFYVRALIEAYMRDYQDAEIDYAHFLKLVPNNWAGLNDYAWVLLKDGKSDIAATVTSQALKLYPNNPWLLNTRATALYDIGDIAGANIAIQLASRYVAQISVSAWSVAYPGNNPQIAQEGVYTFKKAVAYNLSVITSAATSQTGADGPDKPGPRAPEL